MSGRREWLAGLWRPAGLWRSPAAGFVLAPVVLAAAVGGCGVVRVLSGDPAGVVVLGLGALVVVLARARRRAMVVDRARAERIAARRLGQVAAVEHAEQVQARYLQVVTAAGRDVDPADLDVRLWQWTCQPCGLWCDPVTDRAEAVFLAGEHDTTQHKGRPSAFVGLVGRLLFALDGGRAELVDDERAHLRRAA